VFFAAVVRLAQFFIALLIFIHRI